MKKNFFKNKISKSFAKKWHKFKIFNKRKGWLAYHGIERSGSNFLCACLMHNNIDIINLYAKPSKNSTYPQHKHFRWYEDKSRIPSFRTRFYNDLKPKNIFELNKICKYPSDTCHVIIRKKHAEAVASIMNHGIRMGWFTSRKNALEEIESISNDYLSYYNFWEGMQTRFPHMVKIIDHKELIKSSSPIKELIQAFKLHFKGKIPEKYHFDRVEQSRVDRKVYYNADDIKHYLKK